LNCLHCWDEWEQGHSTNTGPNDQILIWAFWFASGTIFSRTRLPKHLNYVDSWIISSLKCLHRSDLETGLQYRYSS